jgi:crossover junction endodeoxyribonuclease RusA
MIELTIPYPPSINHLHRRVGVRTLLSKEGRRYYSRVREIVASFGLSTIQGRVALDVEVYPPDNRRRDLDNVTKAIGDSLVHSAVIEDDSQIDSLSVRRMPSTPGGAIILRLSKMVA